MDQWKSFTINYYAISVRGASVAYIPFSLTAFFCSPHSINDSLWNFFTSWRNSTIYFYGCEKLFHTGELTIFCLKSFHGAGSPKITYCAALYNCCIFCAFSQFTLISFYIDSWLNLQKCCNFFYFTFTTWMCSSALFVWSGRELLVNMSWELKLRFCYGSKIILAHNFWWKASFVFRYW